MGVSTSVSDTTRASVHASIKGSPCYITVEMSRGEVTCARLHHAVDRCPLSEDITHLFTDEGARLLLDEIWGAIDSEKARIKRIMGVKR